MSCQLINQDCRCLNPWPCRVTASKSTHKAEVCQRTHSKKAVRLCNLSLSFRKHTKSFSYCARHERCSLVMQDFNKARNIDTNSTVSYVAQMS
jgi:hypothetical protein